MDSNYKPLCHNKDNLRVAVDDESLLTGEHICLSGAIMQDLVPRQLTVELEGACACDCVCLYGYIYEDQFEFSKLEVRTFWLVLTLSQRAA